MTEKRRKAAQLLLDFYKGRITNDQMDDTWPREARDPALSNVFWAKWGMYSDLREGYMELKLRRNYSVAKSIHKCLVFLESGFEYEWIGSGLRGGMAARIFELLDKHRRDINRAGDQSVWPFYRKDDYKRACQQQD